MRRAAARAPTKWLARFAHERPHAGLDDLKTALDALLLCACATDAHTLVARHRLGDVIGPTDTPRTAAQDSDTSPQR